MTPSSSEANESTATTTTTASERLIGKDLLDWQEDHANDSSKQQSSSHKMKKVVVKQQTKAKKAAASSTSTPKNNKGRGASTASSSSKRTKATSHLSSQLSSPSLSSPNEELSLSSSSTAVVPLHVRHALVVDTRALDTFQGMTTSREVLGQVLDFLRLLALRGASPCILASSCIKDSHHNKQQSRSPHRSSSRGTLQVKAERVTTETTKKWEEGFESDSDDDDTEKERPLSAVPVRPPVNAGNLTNRGAVFCPKRLQAHDSWQLFGDLVHQAIQQDKLNRASSSTVVAPLEVTLLTNDVAFLCDTKEASHKLGLKNFWDQVRPLFRDDLLRSIDIVVAETGAVELTLQKMDQDNGNDEDEEESVHSTKNADLQRKTRIAQCLHNIQTDITARAETDYNEMRGYDDPTHPVELRLSSMENADISYKRLARKWTRDIMSPPSATSPLSFSLPETIDGMQCTFSLDVSYKIMPYRVDSTAAAGMLADLQLLVDSDIGVLQLVPLSCIDASLMFGVPMSVRAAAESELEQYKEMKSLLGFLLRYLSDNELGLILRSTGGGSGILTQFGAPLHHMDGQLLLLLAEELPGRDLMSAGQSQEFALQSKPIPSAGVLFRYANADQLLNAGSSEAFSVDGDSESLKQLAECVETSLDDMKCDSINPLMIDEMNLGDVKTGSARSERTDIQAPPVDDEDPMVTKETTDTKDPGDDMSVDDEIHNFSYSD